MTVRNLSVIFVMLLNFGKQINAVVKRSLFHLHSVARLKLVLSQKDFATIVHDHFLLGLLKFSVFWSGQVDFSSPTLKLDTQVIRSVAPLCPPVTVKIKGSSGFLSHCP